MTFFGSEIGSAFGGPGDTPPPKIPRSTPFPPPLQALTPSTLLLYSLLLKKLFGLESLR